MSNGFLPCPFCGLLPALREKMDEALSSTARVPWYTVSCTRCDFLMTECNDLPGLRDRWNLRAPFVGTSLMAAADEMIDAGYADTRGLLTREALRYRLVDIMARCIATRETGGEPFPWTDPDGECE